MDSHFQPGSCGVMKSTEATLRVGGTTPILSLVGDFGVDPLLVLREAGIDPGLLDNPDNLITYRARGRLMAGAVRRTGCQHFGLLVGQRMNLQSLGLLGLLARNAPDVGTALRTIVDSLRLHSRGAVMTLSTDKVHSLLTYDAWQSSAVAADQIGDGSVAMMLNVMQTLCGPDFRPVEAWFAHREPEKLMPYQQYFRVPLRFDAEHYALLFPRKWLGQQVQGADPETKRLLQKQVGAIDMRHSEALPDVVRGVLRSALLSGHRSAEDISALFSMQVRTLGRRLEDAGTSFHELVDEVRFEISRQMLEGTALSIGQIAGAIGYANASAFTRAFRRWSGTTPAHWRAQHLQGRGLP